MYIDLVSDEPLGVSLKRIAEENNISYEIKDLKSDGYVISCDKRQWFVSANNERSLLWAINDIKQNSREGHFTPRFDIRGINPCESLSRHSSEQVLNLLYRMIEWRMNTLILHTRYGYNEHGQLIETLCSKLGIDIIKYIHSVMEITPDCPVSFFAKDENDSPLCTHLQNETKLCVSSRDVLDYFRVSVRRFLDIHARDEHRKWLFIDSDGYLFCKCKHCIKIHPREQWLKLFRIIAEEFDRVNRSDEIYYLSYCWRYALPDNKSIFNDSVTGIMFDTHQRYRWRSLNEDHPRNKLASIETQSDPRAGEIPLNKYLLERLFSWRETFRKKIFVFENLMIQGTISCPQPNTAKLINDLDILADNDINGMIYEVFEPGIQSFENQLESISKALWDNDFDYHPGEFETLMYQENVEAQESNYNYKNQFHVLSYLTTDNLKITDAFKEEFGTDEVLLVYTDKLKEFLNNRIYDNFVSVMEFVLKHENRFDWIMIGFNLFRAIDEKLEISHDSEIVEFLNVDKLWDFLEKHENPRGRAKELLNRLLLLSKNKKALK